MTTDKPKRKQDRKRHPAANGGKWLWPITRLAIYLRDWFTCVYCNANLAGLPAHMRTIDHVIPVALGGTNSPENLVTCCKQCNDRKQAQTGPAYVFARFAWEYATERLAYINQQLATPLNRKLAKAIIAGTLDLTDVLKEQTK